jgi:hypothetical protein
MKREVEPKIELPRFEWPAWVQRILQQPASSYITILLLQLKVIWGMWWYKEMTMGDTEAYFIDAARWLRDGKTSLAWSPLYSTFIGELFHFSRDAFTILILHRVLIVLTLAMLVLALMRRLLPPGIAWLATAWWVVLPIDFNDLYEVHMFAVIPLLLAPLAILWWPGPWGRGSAIAILLIEGLLVRNENFASAVMLAVLTISYEFWRSRRSPEKRAAWNRAIPAYSVPLLCAILFASYFYVHRMPSDFWELLEAKHDLNVCESFAVGYQQRHDFDRNPMGNCGHLMHRVFGASVIRGSDLSPDTMSTMSMMTALRANPPAMLEHFRWNVFHLLPNGLQVLLFNYRSGDANPDYAPTYQTRLVLIPSAALCAMLALGAYLFFAERKQWMEKWRSENTPFRKSVLETRIWAWITLGCVCLIVGSVIVTVRPRPAYLFILGITIRAAAGLCAYLVIRRWPRVGAPFASAFPVIALAAVALTPSFYAANYKGQPRPLFTSYERIAKYEKVLLAPGAVLVSAVYGGQLCSYVGKGVCRGLDYYGLRTHVSPARRWPNVLDAAGATVFYADEAVLDDPASREFISHARTFGWETVASRSGPGEHWTLLERIPATEASDITLENERLALGSGWYDREVWNNVRFRWSSGDAQVLVTPGEPPATSLSVDIEPGPSVKHLPLTVQVLDRAGKAIQTAELYGRATITIQLPAASGGPIMVVFHATESEGKPVPNDPRTLKFRVFKMLLNW